MHTGVWSINWIFPEGVIFCAVTDICCWFMAFCCRLIRMTIGVGKASCLATFIWCQFARPSIDYAVWDVLSSLVMYSIVALRSAPLTELR